MSGSHTSRIYASASARLYQKACSASDTEWSDTSCRGIITFGRNRRGPGSEARTPSGTTRHGAPALEANDNGYWFRLSNKGRQLWKFQIPVAFDYRADKPFFHIFSGQSHLYGLRFDEDDEAANFCKAVVPRACQNSPARASPHALLSLLSVAPCTSDVGARHRCPSRLRLRDKWHGMSLKSKIRRAITAPMGPNSHQHHHLGQRVEPSMISAPQPNSFMHVKHIGVNTMDALSRPEVIDPTVAATLLGKLSPYGITQSICEERSDFIKGYITGVMAMEREHTGTAYRPPAQPPMIVKVERKPVMYP